MTIFDTLNVILLGQYSRVFIILPLKTCAEEFNFKVTITSFFLTSNYFLLIKIKLLFCPSNFLQLKCTTINNCKTLVCCI